MTTTPDLGIPLIAGQQAQPEVTHNEALILFQALLNGVVDRGLNTPPGGPTEGDSYIIGSAPTGVWAGHTDKIAIFYGGSWRIVPGLDDNGTPIAIGARHEGLRLWVRDEDAIYVWTQTGSPPALAWVELQTAGGGAVDSVFGRTGAVVAAASDYDADQVDYDNVASGLAATTVQAAIDEVESEKQPLLAILTAEDASGTSLPNNTITELTYSNTIRDDFGGSAWDGTTFTVPADGVYDLSATGITTGPDSGVLLEFIKNSVDALANVGSSGSNSLHTRAVVFLNMNDTISVRVRQTTGSTRTGRTDAVFSIVKLA